MVNLSLPKQTLGKLMFATVRYFEAARQLGLAKVRIAEHALNVRRPAAAWTRAWTKFQLSRHRVLPRAAGRLRN
jgi:hypothetical protein